MDQYKPVTISPLTGVFDARSSADSQLSGAFYWKQNWQIDTDGKFETACGFTRAYANNIPITDRDGNVCEYKNWDYHKQDGSPVKNDLEVPTLIYPSTANDNTRRLYLGTKTKFLFLDEASGNWTLVGSGFSQDGVDSKLNIRWQCAPLQDKIFLTNSFDPIQYTAVGSNTMQEVTSLQTAGQGGTAITKALVIFQYQGVVLIMNVVEGGDRHSNRIWWSDLNDGTKFGVATDSISDYQDLSYGQRILAASTLQGYLYVFTDTSIWRCNFEVDTTTGAQAKLTCVEVYAESANDSRAIAYRNTLVSDGESFYYAGSDAIYKYNAYMQVPERTEWIFRSSSIIFDDGINGASIDQTSCDSFVSGYWPDRKEIYFSWPIPDAQFVGAPDCNVQPPVFSSGLTRNTLVANVEWETCDYRDYGMTCFCNFKTNVTQDGQCAPRASFFGILSSDLCLKQFNLSVFSHQTYNFDTDSYSVSGYIPRFKMVLPLGSYEDDKETKNYIVDGFIGADVGNIFNLQVGTSRTTLQPNISRGNCGIIWNPLTPRVAKCLMNMSPDQYRVKNLDPAYDHRWNYLARGRFIYIDFYITKKDGSAPTSGPVTLTRIVVNAIKP